MGKDYFKKEYYRLWIEYLKRCGDYKEFCEWVIKRRKNPRLSIPDKCKSSGTRFVALYYIFGLIHSKQWIFEEWWELHKKRVSFHKGFPVQDHIARKILRVEEEFQSKRIIEDYTDYLQSDIDSCIQQFKFYNQGKEPTLNEFREYFGDELKKGYLSQYITIRIDPRGEVLDDILKQIRKHIKEKRKNSQIKNREYIFIRYLKPSTKLRLDELQKYLNVYDLRHQIPKLKPKEIIKRINPQDNTDDIDVQRAYRDFYQKARKIIGFVKRGIFPGPYDKTTLNRKKRNAKKQ